MTTTSVILAQLTQYDNDACGEAKMAKDKELRLMNTQELLTPATQEEGMVLTTGLSTPPLGENSDHLEQNGGQ